MMESLTALYHRNEVFWVGLSAFILGMVTPHSLAFGGIELARTLFVSGGGLIVTSIFVAIYRILGTT